MRATTIYVSSAVMALCFAGCGGGGASTYYLNRNTTLGQELNDLQTAYQHGAMNEEEYSDQRKKLLSRDDHS